MTASLMSRILPQANDNGGDIPPSPAVQMTWAMEGIARLHARLNRRPQAYRIGATLPRPPEDCEHGCATCFLACAAIPRVIANFEQELMALGVSAVAERA